MENYWINGFRNQGETLYNVAGGGVGTTASYTTTGYGKRDVHSKIKFLLSNGFKGHEIGDYLGLKAQMLADAIRAATGMNVRQARLYYTGERMFELMDDGIFDLDELATHFRGLDANGVFLTLASEHFPMGNEYLKGWLTAKYLREFDFDKNLVPQKFEEYLDKLGISVATRGVYHDLRTRESLYEHWQRKDFIPLLRFYASMVIKDYDTIYGFIHHLGLFREGMSAWERESIVFDLLRYHFDTATDISKNHYFGRLQIIVNV